MFRDGQMYLTRINVLTKNQVVSRSFIPMLTAKLGYHLTVKQPGKCKICLHEFHANFPLY